MKYEYKIVTIDASFWTSHIEEDEILKMMHDLAKKDWEFVSAAPIAKWVLFKNIGTTTKILFFFKRPQQ